MLVLGIFIHITDVYIYTLLCLSFWYVYIDNLYVFLEILDFFSSSYGYFGFTPKYKQRTQKQSTHCMFYLQTSVKQTCSEITHFRLAVSKLQAAVTLLPENMQDIHKIRQNLTKILCYTPSSS